MTSRGDWSQTGLKETGETYIVGSDFLIRNESRFAAEDFDDYVALLEEIDTPTRTVEGIRKSGSAILRQTVRTEAAEAALRGQTSTRVIDDYRGVSVLSAYAPLSIKGHDFALLAEIDSDEAFKPVRELLVHTAITAAIFVPLIALLGLLVASRLMQPAREMRATAQEFLDGEDDATFQNQGTDEWGQLGATLNRVFDVARERLSDATAARDETSGMIATLMPRAIGERFQEGERKVVSAEGSASVAVFYLTPDPKLEDIGNARLARDLYEALDDELDSLATREGVDILNSAGLQFTAFCGLTSPIKNHSERLFRFTLAAKRAILAFNEEHDTDIHVMIGFDTGAMLGALVGTTAMAYEIWGPIVSSAASFAYAALPGELVMSPAAEAAVGRKLATKAVTIRARDGSTVKARRFEGFKAYALADRPGTAT